jgi:ribosome biogenesis GTPase
MNQLARPAPDRADDFIHVLVANLDRLVIVAAAKQPDFSPGIIDRFMIAAEKEKIPVTLVITKKDLIQEETPNPAWRIYSELGYPVFEISSKDLTGVENLRNSLAGKHIAFCGHSGVGKTSLLSALSGQKIGEVGEVNAVTGKGRHTTSSTRLIRAQGSTFWVDTPGIREFGLVGITPDNLKDCFPEFVRAGCESEYCSHLENEKGCRAHLFARHPSFLKIRQSLLEDQD